MSVDMFLKKLAECNELRFAPVQRSVHFEIASWIRETCERQGPALVFHDPININAAKKDLDRHRKTTKISYANNRTFKIPVLGGLYANPDHIKRILCPEYGDKFIGAPNGESVKRYVRCSHVTENDLLTNHSVKANSSPCQEVVLQGGEVDLNALPICSHNSKDAGKFITAGVQVVKWINGITHGLGIHRMMKIDSKRLSCLAPPNRRVGFPHYENNKIGTTKGVKMAVLIGAPPEVVLASQAKLDPLCEKYIVASNLQQRPVRLTKCITSDLLVPADTEIVLECTTIPNSEWDDTPFGEYPGTYSYRSNAFQVYVDAITMKKEAIYQTILTGKVPQEDSNLCAIPYAADVYGLAQKVVEKVTDISVFLGNNVFDTIICIDKKSNSQVENLMHLLLGNKYLKSVTVLDSDLPATEESWRFAFNTRYQPNRDTIITNLSLGASLDPSSPLFQSTSKIAMDCTIPIGNTEEETKLNKFRHSVANTQNFDVDFTKLEKI